MKRTKFLGAVLVVLGVLASADGGPGRTLKYNTASIAPLGPSAREQETVVIPVWTHLGVAALGVLLLARDRRRPSASLARASRRGGARPLSSVWRSGE